MGAYFSAGILRMERVGGDYCASGDSQYGWASLRDEYNLDKATVPESRSLSRSSMLTKAILPTWPRHGSTRLKNTFTNNNMLFTR